MKLDFVNRESELQQLDAAAKKGGLLVVYGRRRVGKTRLLRHWLEQRHGHYSQSIEAQREIQIQQIVADLQPQLQTVITPKTWPEFFEILSRHGSRWVLCIDEFPYLVAVDPSLPSQLQKWLDHSMPDGCLLVLAGSSTRMMHDAFLRRSAPLYGRAHKLLPIRPMSYSAFCAACRQDAATPESFEKFSCVGGIPKYWEFVETRQSCVSLAESLYFDFAPYMEQEPQRILRDEGVSGLNAVAALEAIGRGAERPSEIAARLGTAQTNLSRLLNQLLDASILARELPFGESVRSTKKILYRIQDPTLRFWFRVFSPHQSLWRSYSAAQKRKLIHDHAVSVFEDCCREKFPGAQRYWSNDLEIDIVAPDPADPNRVMVAEVKWQQLAEAAKISTRKQLEEKWQRCPLSARFTVSRFEVFDAGFLASL